MIQSIESSTYGILKEIRQSAVPIRNMSAALGLSHQNICQSAQTFVDVHGLLQLHPFDLGYTWQSVSQLPHHHSNVSFQRFIIRLDGYFQTAEGSERSFGDIYNIYFEKVISRLLSSIYGNIRAMFLLAMNFFRLHAFTDTTSPLGQGVLNKTPFTIIIITVIIHSW